MMADLAKAVAAMQGKTIARARVVSTIADDDPWGVPTLLMDFIDGSALRLYDDGQCCCENRYLHTDDDLTPFAGATFLGARVQDAPSIADVDEHEVQFLIIDTSLGSFTVETHNEHNGYYGGFDVAADVVAPSPRHRTT